MRFCSQLGKPRCRLGRLSGEDDVILACICKVMMHRWMILIWFIGGLGHTVYIFPLTSVWSSPSAIFEFDCEGQ